MKNLRLLTALPLMLAVLTTTAGAGNPRVVAHDEAAEAAESTLLEELSSEATVSREQAAYSLGELRSAKAVIPLMRMLRSSRRDSERIVAALALCRIGDGRGTFAVRQAAKFDDSNQVRNACAFFYNQYVEAGSFAFIPVN